ncbi:MAG: hypothetical protein V1792_02100 [Pseudomonadota bacterium]
MEHKDSRQKRNHSKSVKRPYEPPKATVAPVKIEERLMQCNFSSYRVCGPNR